MHMKLACQRTTSSPVALLPEADADYFGAKACIVVQAKVLGETPDGFEHNGAIEPRQRVIAQRVIAVPTVHSLKGLQSLQ